MIKKKKVIGVCGSASVNSGNLSVLKYIKEYKKEEFNIELINDLTEYPHFKTALTDKNVPQKIIEFRNKIANADGVIICTPEYVFSIPSGLKNILEWSVSKTIFTDKPIGIITASANGEKGHEELKLIMSTIQAKFTDKTTLLIQGIKGKVDEEGSIINKNTEIELRKFIQSLSSLINS